MITTSLPVFIHPIEPLRRVNSRYFVVRRSRAGGNTPGRSREMAQHIIPPGAGPYRIITTMAGSRAVTNDRTGKRKVWIPCRDAAHAEEILRKLEQNDHNGVVNA